MQQFKSRGKIYNLPDSATHAVPGVCHGIYFMDGGKWFFIGDMESVFVPVWANTLAIDEDGAIWAYESTAEDVRLVPPVPGYPGAWADYGDSNAKGDQIGCLVNVPDWKGSKVDLRDLKLQFLSDSLSVGRA